MIFSNSSPTFSSRVTFWRIFKLKIFNPFWFRHRVVTHRANNMSIFQSTFQTITRQYVLRHVKANNEISHLSACNLFTQLTGRRQKNENEIRLRRANNENETRKKPCPLINRSLLIYIWTLFADTSAMREITFQHFEWAGKTERKNAAISECGNCFELKSQFFLDWKNVVACFGFRFSWKRNNG